MTSTFQKAFEDEFSDDAKAILEYARRWGEPFARLEVADVAPGAAWDPLARYPRTVAKVDPIRELLRAGLIEVMETRAAQGGPRGGNRYKVYRLTESVKSLADLLDELEAAAREGAGYLGRVPHDIRAEILERFGDPR